MPFEPNYGANTFAGEALAKVLDPTGQAPAEIIKVTDAFVVRVTLTFEGSAAPIMLNNHGFEWLVIAYVDNVGPPWHEEQQIGANKEVFWDSYTPFPGPAPLTYTVDIDVPAGTLLPGIYKLGVVITSQVAGDGATGNIYGFTEGAVFQIAAG